MVRRTSAASRRTRRAAAATVLVCLLTAGAVTSTYAAAAGTAGRAAAAAGLVPSLSKASPDSIDIVSSSLKVVSSTGHKLRVRLLAFRSSTGTKIDVDVETRNRAEQHEWAFQVPDAAVSVSAKGTGMIHLTSQRSGGDAIASLKMSPHGLPTLSKCQGRTATRTRHVLLSGTLLLRTRSTGKHAWGKVGSAHRKLRFSTRSKVTWVKAAASNCPTPTIACRSTFAWTGTGGPQDDYRFLTGDNRGAHSEIAGFRLVSLAQPAGATREDIVSLPDSTSNQLIVNQSDGSATMQVAFRGGTATLTAPQPATTTVEPCGTGKQKVSVEFWPADFANGPTPIRVPAQIFGGFSLPDTPAGDIERITLMP